MKKNNFNRRQFVTAVSARSLAAIVSAVPAFGNTTKGIDKPNLIAHGDEQKWIEIDNVLYGAKANDLGKIGGGSGYKNILTKGDYTVTDLDTLLDVLAKAKAGQIIFIPSETTLIDMTARIYIEELVLEVPEGVTLAGDRGLNGSKGAVLTSDSLKTPLMIRAGGPNVRITGLRIQGPNPKRYIEHHKRSYGPPPYTSGLGKEYYYKFPTSNGIVTEHPHLEVDNCEISAFAHGGICLNKGAGHHIHHNLIHKCQYNGLGYGVVLSRASSLIEYNLFNENRHSIAGTGRPGEGYIARHNVEMGISLSHCFDMHGGRDRKDGSDIAGTSIEIYNNTFCAPTKAVVIRGVPEEKCEVHHNWFQKHSEASEVIRAEKNTNIFKNVYGTRPTAAK